MAVMGDGHKDLFYQAVSRVMREWHALNICVDNLFGGPKSKEKALWLEEVTVDFMSRNVDVQSWELEDYLSVLMDQEFHTFIEDASLPMISKKICDLYAEYRRGNIQLIQEFITKSQPASSVGVQCVQQESVEDEFEDVLEDLEEETEDGEQEGDQETVEKDLERLQLVDESNRADGVISEETLEDIKASEDEEWQVVRRGRRKSKSTF